MSRSTPASPTERVLDELGSLVRHLTRITAGADEGPPLTATQRLGLFELAEHGPLRLTDLAQRLGVSAPTATRTADALCGHGWVERVPDPTDRRAQRVGVTRVGRKRVAEWRARALAAFEPATAALSRDELTELVALLARLREALSSPQAATDERTG